MGKWWAAGTAIVMSLALGGLPAALAQVASPAAGGPTQVTATQACVWTEPGGVPTGTCAYTASDPRVTGTLTVTITAAVGGPGGDDYVQTFDATLQGPDGTWQGRYWVTFDLGTKTAWATSVLSGDGAYAGWTYVASGNDMSMTGNHDLVGVLYQGPPPPGMLTGPLPSPASE
jgi:hypothetical protein